jgi:RND family efflux transporter MFP subunit
VTPPAAPRRSRWLGALLATLLLCAAIAAFALRNSGKNTDAALTWTVAPVDLRITVTERGTLESQKTVNGVCEVEGYDNKIIFIVEEGSTVQSGDVVVRFDSSAIDTEIAEETLEVAQAAGVVETKKQELEVARNTGESEIAAAELELTLARLDLEKYEKGDYLVTLNDLQGKIALARVELEKAESTLKNTRDLLKKGFREPEQVRVAEQDVERAKFYLQRDEETLEVTQKFDHTRKLTEFKAKADEAERKLARARGTADANNLKARNEYEAAKAELKIQQEQLAEEQKQKDRCEIKATQAGVVAYANEEWWSESRRIREGGTVYERQTVFFIPDMELMQVEVKIHESEVKRIAAGQKAILRVDAFANQSFTGTVKSVAQLSKSDSFFGSGVKEYTTIVVFDEKASVALRPGMTAEVEILVDNLSQVLAVPVQAVAEHRGKHYVYAQTAEGVERRQVEIGQTNNRMIVVKSGIESGDVVTLDARSRATSEFRDDEGAESDELTKLASGNPTVAKPPEVKATTENGSEEPAETPGADNTTPRDAPKVPDSTSSDNADLTFAPAAAEPDTAATAGDVNASESPKAPADTPSSSESASGMTAG